MQDQTITERAAKPFFVAYAKCGMAIPLAASSHLLTLPYPMQAGQSRLIALSCGRVECKPRQTIVLAGVLAVARGRSGNQILSWRRALDVLRRSAAIARSHQPARLGLFASRLPRIDAVAAVERDQSSRRRHPSDGHEQVAH
ncbi:hypothetical protein ACI6Q5_17660 [Xanthomonas codiaei]|uniref:Uncharacterized protein n=1 Tax=Xanthomonas codiaei TaxID=56463 RepID=A0ABW9MRA2_9XANT|nr:hypothetical protein [Xanthomonas codiaei]